MKRNETNSYRCPACLEKLILTNESIQGSEISNGQLSCTNGHIFNIQDGIPDLTWPKELADIDMETRKTYEKLADEYEKFASIPFETYKTREVDVRQKMIDQLNIKNDSVVLEIGCGDGRGSKVIAQKLGAKGELYLQELSPAFLNKAKERLKNSEIDIEYSIANGCFLSFPDNLFDAAHHFGGINTFSDVKRSLKELARVVKPGGKVLVGDESMGPWLRQTQFGKIMMNSNPLLKYDIPFKDIPVEARDVKVEWIMMGAFFTLEFTVGQGEPEANYHIKIPSQRGGTHWTRYFGQLEGITDETKKMAIKAQKKSGKSMHEWLEEIVKKAAIKSLNGNED